MKHPITNISIGGEHRTWLECHVGEHRYHIWLRDGKLEGNTVYKNPIKSDGRHPTIKLRADGPTARPLVAAMMAEYPRLKVEHAAWLKAKQEQDAKDHQAALRAKRVAQEAPAMLALLNCWLTQLNNLGAAPVQETRALMARIENG